MFASILLFFLRLINARTPPAKAIDKLRICPKVKKWKR